MESDPPRPARQEPSFRLLLCGALALLVLQGLIAGARASSLEVIDSGDPCWYYAVARNFAHGRGLLDNVLWTYIGNPVAVDRPAGTYWLMGWPALLGAAMSLTGDSPRTAMYLTAALSTLVPVLVSILAWTVLRVAWEDRRAAAAAALLAGALECLQVRLLLVNALPDVTVSFQVALLAAAIAMVRLVQAPTPGRSLVAGLALALPAYLRIEGMLVTTAGLAGILLFLPGPGKARVQIAATTLSGVVLGLVPYAWYFWSHFGQLVPDTRAVAVYMTDYSDFWRCPSPVGRERWAAQGAATLALKGAAGLWRHVWALFRELPPLLGLLGLGGLLLAVGRRWAEARVVALLLLTLFVPPVVAPRVANPFRLVYHLAPFLCVAAAAGLAGIGRRSEKAQLVAALLAMGCLVPDWSVVGVHIQPELVPSYLSGRLADDGRYTPDPAIEPRLGPDDVVLAQESFRVSAYLGVATVQAAVPAPDVLASIRIYRPRYAVMVRGSWLEQCLERITPRPYTVLGTRGDVTWVEFAYDAKDARGNPVPRLR